MKRGRSLKLVTRARPHKHMKRLLKQGIRDQLRKDRLKEIAGKATPKSHPHLKGLKKKFIYRSKNIGKGVL